MSWVSTVPSIGLGTGTPPRPSSRRSNPLSRTGIRIPWGGRGTRSTGTRRINASTFPGRTFPNCARRTPAAGGFQVTGRAGEGVLGEVATLEEAFALVVEHLPEGSGPAVLGTKDDL
ncbi:DUF6193 family natural product biosynthesis protein [Streptomyces sp. NPDC054787]